MELWIRSQDRTTLIRSYEIYIAEYGKDSYVIRAKRTSHILGAYKTIKRALEVLDEMQKYIAGSFTREELLQLFGGTRNSRIVYEMPKE